MSSEDSDVILIKSPALPNWLKWSTQCDISSVRSFFTRYRPDDGTAPVPVPGHGTYDSSLEAGISTAEVNQSDKMQRKSNIWKQLVDASYRTTSGFFNDVSVRVIWSVRKVCAIATTEITPIWSTIDLELKKYVDSLSEPSSINCSLPAPLSIAQPSQQYSVAQCEDSLSSSCDSSSVTPSVISTPSDVEHSDLSTTIHSATEACV